MTRSRTSVHVDAPARLVFDLARDVQRWPELLPHYLRVDPLQRHEDGSMTARMLAVRAVIPAVGLGIPVVWRARTWSDPARLRLRFLHVGGATAGMDVMWSIEASGDGCDVAIDHDFGPAIAAWSVFIDRSFVRPIAGRTLRTFKAIAEAVAQSEVLRPANTSA